MTIRECYEEMGGNYDEVISRLRTDERVLKFLIKVADDGSYELLRKSLEERNVPEAFRAAHTLKGICLNLSLTRLGESASQLTEALRGKESCGSEVDALFKSVSLDYERTVKCINAMR